MPEEKELNENFEQEVIQNYAQVPVNYSFTWTELAQ